MRALTSLLPATFTGEFFFPDLCLRANATVMYNCSYEYTHAVYNGSVVTYPEPGTSTYVNPKAPIYVVQGTSGGLPENVFFDPPPVWSAARSLGAFGYGRLTLDQSAGVGVLSLSYDFISMHGDILDSWKVNKTA